MTRILLATSAAILFAACSNVGTNHNKAVHSHDHTHMADCGHTAVAHMDHTDYLHDGHMHHAHEDHLDEHVIKVSSVNPVAEAPVDASRHDGHIHSMADDMHAAIPHGDHTDFLHDGHLHHVHGDHMDEHGTIET